MTGANLKKIIPYATVLALAAALYLVARQFEFTPHAGRIGPDAWPKGILILMIITCIYEIVRILAFDKGRKEVEGVLEIVEEEVEEEVAEKLPEETHEEPQETYPKLLIAGIALTLAYILFFNVLGFFVDTMLYIILFVLIGRYRKPGVILASGVLGSLAFMFIFMKVVYLSLPIGHAPFSAVSLLLMKLMGIR